MSAIHPHGSPARHIPSVGPNLQQIQIKQGSLVPVPGILTVIPADSHVSCRRTTCMRITRPNFGRVSSRCGLTWCTDTPGGCNCFIIPSLGTSTTRFSTCGPSSPLLPTIHGSRSRTSPINVIAGFQTPRYVIMSDAPSSVWSLTRIEKACIFPRSIMSGISKTPGLDGTFGRFI